MKKKFIILIAVLLIAMFSITLASCSYKNDYSGEATIKYTFDKEYQNLNVSCPSADIIKDSATAYTIKLNKTAPVEVLISAHNKETLSKRYTSEELKKGTITENITLENVKNKLELNFDIKDDYDLNNIKIVGDDSIDKKVLTTTKLQLVSDNVFDKDITISFGSDYYDFIVDMDMLNKSYGSEMVFKPKIPLVKKNSGEVAIYLGQDYNVTLCNAHKQNEEYELNQGFKVVKVNDYYCEYFDIGVREFISKSELTNKGYYAKSLEKVSLYSNVFDEYYNFKIINEEGFAGYVTYYNNVKYGLFVLGGVKAGQIIYFGTDGEYYVYRITQDDVDKKRITLSKENCINIKEILSMEEKTVSFNFVDKEGKPLDITSGKIEYSSNEYEYNQPINIKFNEYVRETLEFNDLKDKNGVNYAYYGEQVNNDFTEGYLANIFAELLFSEGKEVTINIKLEPLYNVKIQYYDLDSKKVIYEDSKNVKNNQDIYVYYNGYSIEDSKISGSNIVYINEIHGSEPIVINVRKLYDIKLFFTNAEIVEKYKQYANEFRCDNDVILLEYVLSNNIPFPISHSMLGKSMLFVAELRSNGEIKDIIRLEFLLKIPETLKDGDTIEITIVEVPNEWIEN